MIYIILKFIYTIAPDKKVKSKSRLQTSIDNFFIQKKEDTSCKENIEN